MRHATELQGVREQYAGEIKELKAQYARSESEMQKYLDEAGKTAMTGELKALKAHNEQLAGLLVGKADPAEAKAKK